MQFKNHCTMWGSFIVTCRCEFCVMYLQCSVLLCCSVWLTCARWWWRLCQTREYGWRHPTTVAWQRDPCLLMAHPERWQVGHQSEPSQHLVSSCCPHCTSDRHTHTHQQLVTVQPIPLWAAKSCRLVHLCLIQACLYLNTSFPCFLM